MSRPRLFPLLIAANAIMLACYVWPRPLPMLMVVFLGYTALIGESAFYRLYEFKPKAHR